MNPTVFANPWPTCRSRKVDIWLIDFNHLDNYRMDIDGPQKTELDDCNTLMWDTIWLNQPQLLHFLVISKYKYGKMKSWALLTCNW